MKIQSIYTQLFLDYPQLETCREAMWAFYEAGVACYERGGMVLICGNGGSAADAEHIVGELMKGFLLKRPLSSDVRAQFAYNGDSALSQKLQGALPAISLVSQSALITAYANDVDPSMIFAQQVYGYGRKENLLLALSTSGNSLNTINALKTARALGMPTVALVGKDGGEMAEIADYPLVVPAMETFKVQELHLPVYHTWCAMLEEYFFGKRETT